MQRNRSDIILPAIVIIVVSTLLAIVQTVPDKPLLLAERLFRFGGWLQVALVTAYAGFLAFQMQFRERRERYRVFSWLIFSIVFYSQLILGIGVDSLFLMTGKLHLPIPAIILAGPIYRFSSWFMVILFFSTLLLTGPAWCSQLCYFGAFDAVAARGKKKNGKAKFWLKPMVLIVIVAVAFTLRVLNSSGETATLLGILFGISGLSIVIFISRKRGYMYHCTHFCPIGTIVNNVKKISPFRYGINDNCTKCNRCIKSCSYFALSKEGLANGAIGRTCTYCGDCITSCRHDAFEYRFPGLTPLAAERLWIILTVSLHALFIAIARV